MTKHLHDHAPSPELEQPEFSRTFEVLALTGKRTEVELQASEAECEALARRFGVERISSLKARVVLTPFASGNKVAMKASFGAEVQQSCVVTLEPLTSRAEGEFMVEFVPGAFVDQAGNVDVNIDEEDPPEPIVDGRIEVGELIAQHLGLEIDPFPRAPGVVFEGFELDGGEADGDRGGPPNPFAVLQKLKSSKA